MATRAKTSRAAKPKGRAAAEAPKKAVKKAAKKPAKKARAKAKGDDLMTKLKRYVRAHAQGFLQDPNITSVGIGYKTVDGKEKLAVQFSVHAKVAPQGVAALGSTPIPQELLVEGEHVPTDVIERSYAPTFTLVQPQGKDERRARADVVRPGMSVGSVRTTAGTLGTFVRDRHDRRIVMLSNWHVLHGPGGALGDDVVQPGKHDDDRVDQNRVGKLLRSHLGAAGDCAIASIANRQFSNDILDVGRSVARIGEPQLKDRVVKSGRTTAVTYGIVTRLEVNSLIPYGGGVTEIVGGFEIGPDPKRPAPSNEISRGGDSGSVWLAVDAKGKPTDVMLGLHFAGDADLTTPSEFALACYAESVMNKLEVEPVGAVQPLPAAAEDADDFRQGFDRAFLPFFVDLPKFTAKRSADLAALEGDKEIRYCHFSVWLSKSRRYPTCVAWNVDGARFKRLNRVGFRTDRRGTLENHQLSNDIYVANDLDRGHIARRADLCWGTMAEARQGNYDSFFYTNIAPQHAAFNQSDDRSADPEGGIWGRLENTVFDAEQPHDLRVSLLGGPVISSEDRKFVQNGEETHLPREYWKVVAYVDDEDGREKVFAFLLTQASLIEGFVAPQGLNFDDWLWARITLDDLEQKTGVKFPKALHDREVPFVAPQGVGVQIGVLPLLSAADYFAG